VNSSDSRARAGVFTHDPEKGPDFDGAAKILRERGINAWVEYPNFLQVIPQGAPEGMYYAFGDIEGPIGYTLFDAEGRTPVVDGDQLDAGTPARGIARYVQQILDKQEYLTLAEAIIGKPSGLYRTHPGEHIVAAAVKVGRNIYLGSNHEQATSRAISCGAVPAGKDGFDGPGYGFLTSNKRWVSRLDALAIARKARQRVGQPLNQGELDSCDIRHSAKYSWATDPDNVSEAVASLCEMGLVNKPHRNAVRGGYFAPRLTGEAATRMLAKMDPMNIISHAAKILLLGADRAVRIFTRDGKAHTTFYYVKDKKINGSAGVGATTQHASFAAAETAGVCKPLA